VRKSVFLPLSISILIIATLAPSSVAAGETTIDGTVCTIVGTPGDDKLDGTTSNDVICGLGGDDVISAGDGNDTIEGGDGNDAIEGAAGNDIIDGGDGNDKVDSGAGDDQIELGQGDDTGNGGPGADKLWGGDGSDSLVLDSGNDWVDAGVGNDNVWLGAGDDYALGGPGSDLLFGGDGRDSLIGGDGSDSFNGGSGADVIDGGQPIGKDRNSCKADKADKIRNCFYDSKGPSIISLGVSPASVDTSTSAKFLTVRVRVKDSGAGVKNVSLNFVHTTTGRNVSFPFNLGITSCEHFTEWGSAEGPWLAKGCRISGSPNDGIYELTTQLPQYTVPGKFQLNSASASDVADNGTSLSLSDLTKKKMAVTFRQVGVGDGKAPVLQSIAFLNNKVDTSQQSRILTLRASVTDPGAGLQNIYFQFGAGGTQGGATFMYSDGSLCENGHAIDPGYPGSGTGCLVSGTKNSAVIEMKVMLPAYSAKKSHKLQWVTATDWAGNNSVTGDPLLANRGLAISFTQVGIGDSTGPSLKSVSVLNGPIDTGSEAQQVRIRVRVLDNISGVQSFGIAFQRISSSGKQVGPMVGFSCWSQTCPTSGNDRDGTYEISAELPVQAAEGIYRLVWFSATDKAGNSITLGVAAIKKAKLYVGFSNG